MASSKIAAAINRTIHLSSPSTVEVTFPSIFNLLESITAIRPRAAHFSKWLNEKGLTGFELNFGILELRKFRWVLDLLSTGLLSHLPQDLGHLACNLGRSAEDNGCVTGLQDTGVLLHGNHGSERLDGLKVTILKVSQPYNLPYACQPLTFDL